MGPPTAGGIVVVVLLVLFVIVGLGYLIQSANRRQRKDNSCPHCGAYAQYEKKEVSREQRQALDSVYSRNAGGVVLAYWEYTCRACGRVWYKQLAEL